MAKKTNPIDSLRGSSKEKPALPAEPVTIAPAYLVYFGRTGPEEEFEHDGAHCSIASGKAPLLLRAGLNIVDGGQWEAYKMHPPVALMLAKGWVTETTEDLRGWSSPDRRRKLASASTSPEGLEHLVTLEKARPVTASRVNRRDSEMVAQLERKLLAYSRMPPLILDDLHQVASARTATAPTPPA